MKVGVKERPILENVEYLSYSIFHILLTLLYSWNGWTQSFGLYVTFIEFEKEFIKLCINHDSII